MAAFDLNMFDMKKVLMQSTMMCGTMRLALNLSSLHTKTIRENCFIYSIYTIVGNFVFDMGELNELVCIPVECLEPEPAEPDELPGLSRPGDCVKSIPEKHSKIQSFFFLPNSLFIHSNDIPWSSCNASC